MTRATRIAAHGSLLLIDASCIAIGIFFDIVSMSELVTEGLSWAAALVGLTILFPLAFAALLIRRRRLQEIAVPLLLPAIATLVLGPGILIAVLWARGTM